MKGQAQTIMALNVESCYAECHDLFIIILNVVMLRMVMLSLVTLNVIIMSVVYAEC
jgi:hypothetical protein